VVVEATFEIPWTSSRITPTGLAALAVAGIAPPTSLAETRCPYCASALVVQDSLFGPTQCRSLFYCRSCRQPFEALKVV
jgi:ring-1,2-phenylacetyl-CoA epoxidase subunit PaaD